MNKRNDALREALYKNEEDSQRWQTYLKENEEAIKNMIMFGKQLTVDVMVPVGKKAFMAGHLLHTNEVLVGHYQGYFSKCTTFKAKEICEARIKMARDYIKKLETEADLWENKLNKPYAEGVMPVGEEREIIEEFNEETERLWREKHKINIRLDKQKNRRERELQQNGKSQDNSTDDDLFKTLEEAQLVEELEQELDQLKLETVNDDTIRKLMSGEIKLPQEKKRKSHHATTLMEIPEEKSLALNVVNRSTIVQSTNTHTNNNVTPNPCFMNAEMEETEEAADIETLPEEVVLIKQQAKYLNESDQIGFYDYQIQIVREKLHLLPLNTPQELDKKIHLLNVLENLEELLEEAEETVGAAELEDKHLYDKHENDKECENQENRIKVCNNQTLDKFVEMKSDYDNKLNKKRRISFALKEETLEFKKHESVLEMFHPKIVNSERDIIKLSDNDAEKEKCTPKKDFLNKKDMIKAKVEKQFELVAENQSKQDFDLVKQILNSSMGEINTLHIKFKHSEQKNFQQFNNESSIIPASPADFYNLYIKSQKSENVNEHSTAFINNYDGEDKLKVPILKEKDRQSAYVDPKSEFSNPLQAKSILKNKTAVDKENHRKAHHNKKQKVKSPKTESDNCLSAYYKVMNDVVEKPLTEPEPLPDEKHIDAHTPKKRISRFKQMRQENAKSH